MPITVTADALDELPEALRAKAKEAGGKFVVADLGDGFAVENVVGLKKTLAEERAGRKAAEKLASSFEGLKAEDVADAVKALESLKAGTLKSSKELEDFKRALEEKAGAERKKVDEKLSKREQQLRQQLVDAEATKHLVKAGGGDSLRALMHIARAAAKVEEDEHGELRIVLHDEQGRPLISKKQGNNDPMQWDEFVSQMRDASDLKPLFKQTASGGSGGTSQSGGSVRHGEPIDITKMSPTELMARGDRKTA